MSCVTSIRAQFITSHCLLILLSEFARPAKSSVILCRRGHWVGFFFGLIQRNNYYDSQDSPAATPIGRKPNLLPWTSAAAWGRSGRVRVKIIGSPVQSISCFYQPYLTASLAIKEKPGSVLECLDSPLTSVCLGLCYLLGVFRAGKQAGRQAGRHVGGSSSGCSGG